MGTQFSKFVAPEDLNPLDRHAVLESDCSPSKIAEKLKNGDFKRVVVVCGAGISVSAGIPDFRTPGTGLYDNLQSYGLPDDEPTAIFDIEFFAENPMPFSKLASEMYPRPLEDGSLKYQPTLTHFFLRLLHEKGVLRRVYTQNIDCLERACGVPPTHLVECHGSFSGGHCITCKNPCDPDWLRSEFFKGNIPTCQRKLMGTDGTSATTNGTCDGYCKPDITFFGENLPERFHRLHESDMEAADLLIVIGTSLQVQPVSSLPGLVGMLCPRLLINREPCGLFGGSDQPTFIPDPGFRFLRDDNYRDVFQEGDCDVGISQLCKQAEWIEDLLKIQQEFTVESAKMYAAKADANFSYSKQKADDRRRVQAVMAALSQARIAAEGEEAEREERSIEEENVDVNFTKEQTVTTGFSKEELEHLANLFVREGGNDGLTAKEEGGGAAAASRVRDTGVGLDGAESGIEDDLDRFLEQEMLDCSIDDGEGPGRHPPHP